MSKYKEGDIVKAKITNIEKYGVFASLDDECSGLIHISEITDKYVKEITDFVELNDEVMVKILNVGEKSNQFKLSMKAVDGAKVRRKRKKIKETVFGFYLLKKKLPGWINKKIEEIEKNN